MFRPCVRAIRTMILSFLLVPLPALVAGVSARAAEKVIDYGFFNSWMVYRQVTGQPFCLMRQNSFNNEPFIGFMAVPNRDTIAVFVARTHGLGKRDGEHVRAMFTINETAQWPGDLTISGGAAAEQIDLDSFRYMTMEAKSIEVSAPDLQMNFAAHMPRIDEAAAALLRCAKDIGAPL